MITNSSLTIYHKEIDYTTRLEKWVKYNYENVWFFGGKSASFNNGYDDNNSVEIRIPYDKNNGLNINNFEIGDIIVQGTLNQQIETQQDLSDYLIYNITSIKNNNFGINQHIHISGK